MEFFEYPVDPKEIKTDFVLPQSFYYVEEEFIDDDSKSKYIQKKFDLYCNNSK